MFVCYATIINQFKIIVHMKFALPACHVRKTNIFTVAHVVHAIVSIFWLFGFRFTVFVRKYY